MHLETLLSNFNMFYFFLFKCPFDGNPLIEIMLYYEIPRCIESVL